LAEASSAPGIEALFHYRGSAGRRSRFVAVYAKLEKENLSDAEKKALAKILRPIKRQVD
jgi:hypothetical protein